MIDQGDWYDGIFEVYIYGNDAADYYGNVTLEYQIVVTTVDLNKYSARTGKRYHCDPNCWGLRNAWKVWKVPLSKAKKKKLTKCHVCY